MYEIRILDEAIHDLQRLDKVVGRRVVKRIIRNPYSSELD